MRIRLALRAANRPSRTRVCKLGVLCFDYLFFSFSLFFLILYLIWREFLYFFYLGWVSIVRLPWSDEMLLNAIPIELHDAAESAIADIELTLERMWARGPDVDSVEWVPWCDDQACLSRRRRCLRGVACGWAPRRRAQRPRVDSRQAGTLARACGTGRADAGATFDHGGAGRDDQAYPFATFVGAAAEVASLRVHASLAGRGRAAGPCEDVLRGSAASQDGLASPGMGGGGAYNPGA